MRHRCEDSCNMNVSKLKFYRKIKSIRTWILRKIGPLSYTNVQIGKELFINLAKLQFTNHIYATVMSYSLSTETNCII